MASSLSISTYVSQEGSYIDGHEHEDVVKYRDGCLKKVEDLEISREHEDIVKYRDGCLKKVEDLEISHVPRPLCTDEEPQPSLSEPSKKKLVLTYHDESSV